MVRWMRALLLSAGMLWMVAGVIGPAVAAADPTRLLSAEALQRELPAAGTGRLLVLDASPGPAYRKGHIPGAVHVDPFTLMRLTDAPRAAAQQRFRDWGVKADADQRIVVVDTGGSWMAPRLFWELLHQGLPASRLRLLDGGMARWRAAGGALSTEPAAPAPGDGTLDDGAQAPYERVRVHLPAFLAATADPANHVMLEALPPEYFYGATGWLDRHGHVPHATMWPSEDFFAADKTFRRPEELARVAAHLGIRLGQAVHTYCGGGGGAAAVPFFALKFLLGHDDVRLFAESQIGWLRDPRQLPVWTWSDPHRVRDTAWLATWAGAMLRSSGLSKVTVVDVRTPAAFALGHVPQSVNLPLARLLALRDDDAALAAEIGRAGLDPAHEAVVISERGGLDGDAAVAALLLERAGQARVSVYAGSIDRYLEAGHDLARAAAGGPAGAATPIFERHPGAAPRTLLAGARPMAEPGAGGALPIAWLSAVESTPGDRPPGAGSWLSVPAAAAFSAVGRLEPPAEQWKRLAAAGVPRHARLVIDGRGDAAFAAAARLRLVLAAMGWRDIRIRTG